MRNWIRRLIAEAFLEVLNSVDWNSVSNEVLAKVILHTNLKATPRGKRLVGESKAWLKDN